jgi:hypothetical protein
LASDRVSPDLQPAQLLAFRELEALVRHLGEELSTFRKRALQAEARLRELESSSRSGDLFAEQRANEAEKENEELRARVGAATERTRVILEQVRFLRQQHQREER